MNRTGNERSYSIGAVDFYVWVSAIISGVSPGVQKLMVLESDGVNKNVLRCF